MNWFSRHSRHRTQHEQRRAWWAAPMVATALLGMPWATAQTPRPAATRDAEAIAAKQEKARLADTDTILALSNDGAVLYANDNIKLSGYQYCSQAVALADKGE